MQLEFNFNLHCYDSQLFDLAKLDLSRLHHASSTPSILQAMVTRGACGRVVINNIIDLSEELSVINDISIMTTWIKVYQLSTIRVQWRPEWRVISYQKYEYNDNINKRLSVINDMMKTTWVKGYQLSTIQVQWQPKWMVISYQQYNQPEWKFANYQWYDQPK